MTDTKQPEALYFAEWLAISANVADQRAAVVLRRLHEVNVELIFLLKRYRSQIPLGHQPHMIAAEVDAAIAKAEGESK